MKSANLRSLILAGILGFGMAACSPMQDNGLLSDQKEETKSLTLDKTPKPEELYLKIYSPTYNTPSGQTKAEISGECYISTYPQHSIAVRENGALLSYVDLTPASNFNQQAQCRNGRFNISINVGALTIGEHRIRIGIEARDGTGAVVTNDSQGTATLILTR